MGATTHRHTGNLFATVDAMDVATLVPLFAANGRLVFGNSQPLVGVEDIGTGLTAFFATLAGLHHKVVNEWSFGNDAIVDLKVTHVRTDGQRDRPAGHPSDRGRGPDHSGQSTL